MVKPGPKPRYDENVERTTIRIPESLKAEIKTAADTAGLSFNEWMILAARQQLEKRRSTNRPRSEP